MNYACMNSTHTNLLWSMDMMVHIGIVTPVYHASDLLPVAPFNLLSLHICIYREPASRTILQLINGHSPSTRLIPFSHPRTRLNWPNFISANITPNSQATWKKVTWLPGKLLPLQPLSMMHTLSKTLAWIYMKCHKSVHFLIGCLREGLLSLGLWSGSNTL